MSDTEDWEDLSQLPPAAECERRCEEFTAITDTNTAVAQFFLQDRDWDVQRAVNAYNEDAQSKSDTSKEEEKSQKDPQPHRIKLMTWNIDGLDKNNVEDRTKAVCKTINQENPDVVFLQEVIPLTIEILEQLCPTYQILPGGTQGYFTAVMLKVTSVVYEEHTIHTFHSSRMRRNLLVCQVTVKEVGMTLITTHLESTREHSDERKKQLKEAFKVMKETHKARTVVLGGDLNIRDKELQQLGGLPFGVLDVWEVTGKRPEACYTWDTTRNDNLDWQHEFRPRFRFDRVYLRHGKPGALKAVYQELVGLERIQSCRRYPSDHWGVLCHFDKTPK